MSPILRTGGPGVKPDWFSKLTVYGFLLYPNTFKSSKSSNKRDQSQKKNLQFYDPSLAHKGGGQGVNLNDFLDSLYMVFYYLPIQ